MKNRVIKIGKTLVGGNHPCFIIAEVGINFDGKFDQAKALIDVAAKGGCNAVKFQLFKAEHMYTTNAGKYKVASGQKKDIIRIIKDSELPHAWLSSLRDYVHKRNLEFISSVCDEQSADAWHHAKGDATKIPSSECTHLPLLRHVARQQRPMIVSFGMANMAETDESIRAILDTGNDKLAIMHCSAIYPTPLSSVNLSVLQTLQLAFPNTVVGYSDHTIDPARAPRAAVLLGAKIIEKHITLDRNLPGPDHSFALNPQELVRMVKVIRIAERELQAHKKYKINSKLLGSSAKQPDSKERYYRKFLMRSVFATKDINKGEKFTGHNLAVLRSGVKPKGLEPKYYNLLIKGYKAVRTIPSGQNVVWEDVLQG